MPAAWPDWVAAAGTERSSTISSCANCIARTSIWLWRPPPAPPASGKMIRLMPPAWPTTAIRTRVGTPPIRRCRTNGSNWIGRRPSRSITPPIHNYSKPHLRLSNPALERQRLERGRERRHDGAFASDTFPTVTSSKVRLVLTNFTSAPSIYEFYVYDDAPSNTAPPQRFPSMNGCSTTRHTLADPANGQFEPWFELYNGGPTNVNLAGYYLTSSPTNLFQFQIPSGYSLAPGGFLLVWADGLTGQNSGSDLHVNFSLQSSPIVGLLNSAGQICGCRGPHRPTCRC